MYCNETNLFEIYEHTTPGRGQSVRFVYLFFNEYPSYEHPVFGGVRVGTTNRFVVLVRVYKVDASDACNNMADS